MRNTSKNFRDKLLMASVAGAFAFTPIAAFAQSDTTTPTADRIVEQPADDATTTTDSAAPSDMNSDTSAGESVTQPAPDSTAAGSATGESGTAVGGASDMDATDDTASDSDSMMSDDESVAGETPAVDSETTSALPADEGSGMTGLFLNEQGEDHVLANNYIGKSVYNEAGEKVGDINDLVFTKDGGIEAAIVGVGGFLGIGQHNVAVDFSQINIVEDAESGEIELSIAATRDQLAEAPAFQSKKDRLAEASRQDTSNPASSPMVPGGTTSE